VMCQAESGFVPHGHHVMIMILYTRMCVDYYLNLA
jgi:hypothetical protein